MRNMGIYSVLACLLSLTACIPEQKTPGLINVSIPVLPSRGHLLVQSAETFIGTEYRWGGTERTGIDCSGLIYAAARQAGFAVRRTTTRRMQLDYQDALTPPLVGDLPLFSHDGKKVAHVGIWKDPEKLLMVHSGSSTGVIVSYLRPKGYWSTRLVVSKKLP